MRAFSVFAPDCRSLIFAKFMDIGGAFMLESV